MFGCAMVETKHPHHSETDDPFDSAYAGEPSLESVLDDPIIRNIMASDGVTIDQIEFLAHRMRAAAGPHGS